MNLQRTTTSPACGITSILGHAGEPRLPVHAPCTGSARTIHKRAARAAEVGRPLLSTATTMMTTMMPWSPSRHTHLPQDLERMSLLKSLHHRRRLLRRRPLLLRKRHSAFHPLQHQRRRTNSRGSPWLEKGHFTDLARVVEERGLPCCEMFFQYRSWNSTLASVVSRISSLTSSERNGEYPQRRTYVMILKAVNKRR